MKWTSAAEKMPAAGKIVRLKWYDGETEWENNIIAELANMRPQHYHKLLWLDEDEQADDLVRVKPDFTDECSFITATFINGQWERRLWELVWADGYNEKEEEATYLSLCNEDGEEWGPLEDLKADLYYILPSPPKQ